MSGPLPGFPVFSSSTSEKGKATSTLSRILGPASQGMPVYACAMYHSIHAKSPAPPPHSQVAGRLPAPDHHLPEPPHQDRCTLQILDRPVLLLTSPPVHFCYRPSRHFRYLPFNSILQLILPCCRGIGVTPERPHDQIVHLSAVRMPNISDEKRLRCWVTVGHLHSSFSTSKSGSQASPIGTCLPTPQS